MAILPLRDGDPPAPTAFVPTEASSPAEILGCAETLGIPWRRVLLAEIDAEQKLRGYLQDVEAECPLESALTILSLSALRSWRVRDQVETLACQARTSVRGALKGLRGFFRQLVGQAGPDSAALARHCRVAYERIFLLQRVRRAAARSHGTVAERLAFVCSGARCAFDDAAWALREEDSPRRGHRMEAAVRKVRDEGFLVPRAQTEARSLAELRRIVFESSHRGRRSASHKRSWDAGFRPQAFASRTAAESLCYQGPSASVLPCAENNSPPPSARRAPPIRPIQIHRLSSKNPSHRPALNANRPRG